MSRILLAASIVVGISGTALAEPKVVVTPATAHPGDPVVVSVLGATEMPHGKAGGEPLHFFVAKRGYQAVFAIALDVNEDHILVEVNDGPKPLSVPVVPAKFPETNVIVEEEMANPPKADRDRIDADNRAMGESYAKANGAPQFTGSFRRPPGAVTSGFGEWRTFNDGHRSQHLGLDLAVGEGTRVLAANSGTVVLVRDTFLAGNVIVIAHGGGLSTLYFHLQKATVAEGDTVAAGAPIGLSGHTGRTTGPHLHLSVHVPGGLVDPAAFLKLPLAPAGTAAASK